ncbi:MAG: hypothetical protein K6F56_06760 [Oscillospiraceae bacterium]|nr:hypothetical protein [Oscillospiraceae bacterium]
MLGLANTLPAFSALFFLAPGAALPFFSCKNEKKDSGGALRSLRLAYLSAELKETRA